MAVHEYFSNIIEALQKFRESDFLCDTVLMTDDQHELKAHSVVLAAASPVFQTAFASAADRGPGPLQVNLREYESDVVEIALQFMYTGKLILMPTKFEQPSEWFRLMAVAERLGLDLELMKDCEKTFQLLVYLALILYI